MAVFSVTVQNALFFNAAAFDIKETHVLCLSSDSMHIIGGSEREQVCQLMFVVFLPVYYLI